ncbi:MAG: hypothetical protein R6V41_01490 [Desulfobacteraceae bacterium]
MARKKQPIKEKADPERKAAFDSLPPYLRENLTEEEVHLFLYGEEWPESLFEKMNEFIVKDG